MVEGLNGLEQKCHNFNSTDIIYNTYEYEPRKIYYKCSIRGSLINESEPVTTNTELNELSNDEVTMVWYNSNSTVKFIPNSLFTTFKNLEYLNIGANNTFEIMKPEYLKNAKSLKVLWVYENSVKRLDGKIFVEAPNLEHINFERNQIESIHEMTFNGLPNLQGIYLHKNKITNLHPSTFFFITTLDNLVLSENVCINQEFKDAKKKIVLIKDEIEKSCSYKQLSWDEVTSEKAKFELKQKINSATESHTKIQE